MSDRTRALETDPSVCYRHPGRQSWILCQRCGRTVCPECQILAPVGVHCPECVRETSGGVQWRSTNVTPLKPKRRRTSNRVRSMLSSPALGGGTVGAAQVILGASIALWILGFAGNLPVAFLAALPDTGLQVWRYVTAPFASPAVLAFQVLLSFALTAVFFYLTAPQLERMLGRPKFLAVFFAAAAAGNASAVLAGGFGYGLSAPLFGCFAAPLVTVWDDARVRTQILIMIAINLLLTIVVGGASSLAMLVGAMIAGAGATYLFRIAPDRGWQPRTPGLILAGGCAVLVAFAVVRSLAA